MANSIAQATADAMALSLDEREQLIVHLLEQEDASLSDEWITKIDRRIQDIDQGMETIPADEFFAEMRRKLHEARSLSPST